MYCNTNALKTETCFVLTKKIKDISYLRNDVRIFPICAMFFLILVQVFDLKRINEYICVQMDIKITILAEDGDKGGELAKQWESSIRQALMPVVHVTGPQGSVSSTKVWYIYSI